MSLWRSVPPRGIFLLSLQINELRDEALKCQQKMQAQVRWLKALHGACTCVLCACMISTAKSAFNASAHDVHPPLLLPPG